ncbi:MAG: hypothetical protein OEX97_12995, partial [Acidimicrobiia bacterium]|nr:hypothetical protein [Acidimicrobiia bacterium]
MNVTHRAVVVLLALFVGLASCGGSSGDFPDPGQDYSHLGLNDAEAATLLSLQLHSDYPLYSMRHYAEYDYREYKGPETAGTSGGWACTLFA